MSVKNSRWAGPLFLSLFLLSTAGCTTVSLDEVLKAASADPGGEKGSFIDGVPFFPQDELMCGPAALASVLNFYGHKVDLKEVSREVYHSRLKGSLTMDLLIYAKERGFEVLYYKGGLEDLKARVRENSPIIVFLNLGHDLYPVGHYMVVVGYNEEMKVVVAHSGTTRAKVLSYRALIDDWEKTKFSTLLIKPKQKVDR